MTRFPRPDYAPLARYAFDRRPVEVDLSDNTNLWGGHPAALEVVKGADSDDLARYPALYADELKRAVSRTFGVPAAAVCTGCGSDDVLDAAWRACAPTTAPAVVGYAAPTFSMVEPLSLMNARAARPVPWSEALKDPSRLLADDPALVYVCRPNNPTGLLAPPAWLDALVDAAGSRPDGGPLVVVDEAYADFAGETYAARAAERERVLVTRTLSKAYGLAGLRVGFAVGAPSVIDEVEKARGPYKVGRLATAAAVAALDDAEGWTRDVVEVAVRNRRRLTEELVGRALDPLPSRANFVLIPVAAGAARDLALRMRALGVAIRPFPACPDVGDAVRVTVAPWPLMERFLGALDSMLADDPTRWSSDR
ncbi:MAG: histidinol-phosphate transaminase [Gemmatimonadota bacterium]|jgi:histidinol-phosphate aminotransferase